MLDRFISAVIDVLLAIPPVRFVMGLVDSRWRPLWAALWIAVILYVLSRTMNQLALRRARLRILAEPHLDRRELRLAEPLALGTPATPPSAGQGTTGGNETIDADANPSGPREDSRGRSGVSPMSRVLTVPIPILAGAFVVAAFAVAGVAMLTRPAPNDSAVATPVVEPDPDTSARANAPIDIQYRSGRMEGDHCIGTFEVVRGGGERAQLVAFVMDSTGAVIGRDSARVASSVAGIFVDFRFRYVECDEIANWQMQATTTPRSR